MNPCPECGHELPHNKLPDSFIIMQGGFDHECRFNVCRCTYGSKEEYEKARLRYVAKVMEGK